MIQVQSKFCPLGAPVGEDDGGIIVKGQLDCSLGEDQNVVNVVGSVIEHTLPSNCDRGYRPGMRIRAEKRCVQNHSRWNRAESLTHEKEHKISYGLEEEGPGVVGYKIE